MKSTEFNHDKLNAEICSVNIRKEIHGEDLVLANDITLMVQEGLEELPWKNLIVDLTRCEAEDYKDELQSLRDIASTIKFRAEYTDHRVVITQHRSTLATFPLAKINHFQFDTEKQELRFRVQAECDESSIGRLAGAVREQVRVSCAPAQANLDL